jgi:rubredoxin
MRTWRCARCQLEIDAHLLPPSWDRMPVRSRGEIYGMRYWCPSCAATRKRPEEERQEPEKIDPRQIKLPL